MIIDKKYTFPRYSHVKLTQCETLTNIEHFSMAFVREIGRNGVLYSGIWPWHRLSNWIESNRYIIGKSRAINQI